MTGGSPNPGYALPARVKVATLAGALLGLFLAALDQTIVATAAPSLRDDLGIQPGLYVWIAMAYLVTSTVLVPMCGKLTDRHGRRPVLLAGIAVFLTGSVLCAVAAGPASLIASRAVQGIGAAALFTAAFTIAADLFPPAQRARYSGLFGAVFGAASVLGPLVGGILTDRFGWRWVFLVNLPLGAVALAFIAAQMPALGGSDREHRAPLDLAGAAALLAAVVPLLVAVTLAQGDGRPGSETRWTSPVVLALLAAAAAGVAGFVIAERRARDPLLPLSLFADRVVAVANLANFLVGGTFLASAVFLPFFCVEVLGTSATTAGFTLMPLTLGMLLSNTVGGPIAARMGGTRAILLVGTALVAAGYTLLAVALRPGASIGTIRLLAALTGVGLGPSIPIIVVTVQNAVDRRQLGVATAATRFVRQLGVTIGIALLGTVFVHSLTATAAPHAGAVSLAVRAVYGAAAGVAGAAFLVILALPDRPLQAT